MNSNPVNQNILPFPWFPKTDPPLTGGAQSGQWIQRPQGKLKELADRLVYEGNNARINSLPSPWSRALQLEQAVLNPNYPTRAALLDELFGCLACIGLWKTFGLNLQAKPVNLATLAAASPGVATDLAKTLFAIQPSDNNALYQLADGSNPWDKVYVLELDGINIGFTSPTTLVCPTVHLASAITGMEDWTQAGSFSSPVNYLGDAQKQLLADWLSHVGKEIAGDSRHLKSAQMAGMIGNILTGFATQLSNNYTGNVALAINAANGFPLMAPKAITTLASPVGGIDSSDNGTIASQAIVLLGERLTMTNPFQGTPRQPLILVDPEMEDKLGIPAKNLVLYGNATAQSVGFDKSRLSSQYGNMIEIIDLDDLFLPDLYLLAGEAALIDSASWLSSCLQGVPSINGQKLTPLLPFQERVRDLFSSEELSKKCTLRVIDGAGSPELEVTLAVNIQGLEVPYPITRKFPIKETNIINDSKPVVTIWPNVPDDFWKTYYIFCQVSSTGLTVDGFADYLEAQELSDIDEHVKYYKTDRFPDLLKMSENGKPRGLIPITAPAKLSNANNKWRIGFDFGTSFTNFVIDDGSAGPQRRPLETKLMPLTLAEKESQDNLLYNFFIPQTLFPEKSNPPTATALNTVETPSIPRLFHEARVQWPSSESKAFRERGIKTGFKWEDEQYQYPFLLQLALMISANALADQANTIEWYLSYPSAFSAGKTNSYRQLWERLCADLELLTGLTHRLILSDDSRGLQTEAVAFAKYFGNYLQNVNLVHTACMDVGGGTTDISIWQDNECIHQVSVKFAGRDICTDILRFKPSIIRLLRPEVISKDGDGDGALRKNPNFNSWLDNIFRNSDKELPETLRLSRGARGGVDGQTLSKLTSLMAVGFGGLYYYLGIILRSLAQDGILTSKSTMPVLIGGNGARFLHWIDSGSEFNRRSECNALFEKLQIIGSGFSGSPQGVALTTVSENFKDETAYGLISQGRTIMHDPNIEDSFIAGEAITIGSKTFGALDRISLGDLKANVGKDYKIEPGLAQLRAFVESYDAILIDIESLLPIKELESNEILLWNQVERIVREECSERAMISDAKNIEPEPPFIIGLKALLKALTQSLL